MCRGIPAAFAMQITPVAVTAVDRFTRHRPQHEWTVSAFSAAGLEDAQHRDRQRHGRGFVSLADQM